MLFSHLLNAVKFLALLSLFLCAALAAWHAGSPPLAWSMGLLGSGLSLIMLYQDTDSLLHQALMQRLLIGPCE